MDKRIADLFDWVENQKTGINPVAVREKIVELRKQVDGEENFVALNALYCAVTNLAIRTVTAEGKDIQPLIDARNADMKMFCMEEAMGGDDMIDPAWLDRVVSREIAAERMSEDSFAELARHGAEVLGSPKPQRQGLLRRLFG